MIWIILTSILIYILSLSVCFPFSYLILENTKWQKFWIILSFIPVLNTVYAVIAILLNLLIFLAV